MWERLGLAGVVVVVTAALAAAEPKPKRLWTLRHENVVDAAVVSPDGRTIACTAETRIVFWSIPQGKQLFHLEVGPTFARQVEYLPDGKTLLVVTAGRYSWDWDGKEPWTLTWWDLATRRQVRVLRFAAHGGVSLSPDGKLLVTGSTEPRDLSWKVRDAVSGRVIGEINPLPTWASAFSPDSKRLYIGYTNGAVSVWDLQTRKEQRVLDSGQVSVDALAICPDGKRLAVAKGRTLFVLDVSTGKKLADIPRLTTNHLVWIATNELAASDINGVDILHANTLQKLTTIRRSMSHNRLETKGHPFLLLGGKANGVDLITVAKGEVIGWGRDW